MEINYFLYFNTIGIETPHYNTKGRGAKRKKKWELKDQKWEHDVAELQGGKEMMEMVLSVVNFCLEPVGDIAIDEEVEKTKEEIK
jgi:hypothetical protein